MKQILQSLRTGSTELVDVPTPAVRRGTVLIRTTRSLVSLGTERTVVEFGRAGLIEKARQQPERVKMVLDKIRAEGLLPTMEAVFSKLEQPLPLGYCNAGRVIEVGEGVTDFRVGDRVASNGPHAEFVCVPANLVASIPENVSDEEAAFTPIGAIAIQGLRLVNPTFGETIVVFGLGLIGLVTAQLLQAAGCRVVGIDLDERKLAFSKGKGIATFRPSPGNDPTDFVRQITGDVGADGVIITASSKSDEIMTQAARMSRKRGRVVLVGVVGLKLNRGDFYEKELSFQVSCSYGPGRYDESYEQKGHDYPLPFVRWTEKRNFEAFLQALEYGRLDLPPLMTHRVPLEDYHRIYGDMGRGDVIAAILEYSEHSRPDSFVDISHERAIPSKKGVVGIIGAGNFAGRVILPALAKTEVQVKTISSAGGVNGTRLAGKFGIARSTTDYRQILDDPEVELVVIATRHHLHAPMVKEALSCGKHVFVEKPLAIHPAELEEIIASYRDHPDSTVTVGFNRRFSPHAMKTRQLLEPIREPFHVTATMNAGHVPPDSWVHDMEIGGGRIVGEACHLIDLITFFTGSMVTAVCMSSLGAHPKENTDNASILLRYADGSSGVINYFSNGSRKYSKERIEVFAQGKTIVIDNFRLTRAFGVSNFSKLATRLDKGYRRQFELLADRLRDGGDPLIPFDQLVNTTKAGFAALASSRRRSWIDV